MFDDGLVVGQYMTNARITSKRFRALAVARGNRVDACTWLVDARIDQCARCDRGSPERSEPNHRDLLDGVQPVTAFSCAKPCRLHADARSVLEYPASARAPESGAARDRAASLRLHR